MRISEPDGRPLTGSQHDVKVQTTVTYRYPDPDPDSESELIYGTYTLPLEMFNVPDSGVAAVQVTVPDNATEINLKVSKF